MGDVLYANKAGEVALGHGSSAAAPILGWQAPPHDLSLPWPHLRYTYTTLTPHSHYSYCGATRTRAPTYYGAHLLWRPLTRAPTYYGAHLLWRPRTMAGGALLADRP